MKTIKEWTKQINKEIEELEEKTLYKEISTIEEYKQFNKNRKDLKFLYKLRENIQESNYQIYIKSFKEGETKND